MNIEKIKEFVRLGEELRAEGVGHYFGGKSINVGLENLIEMKNVQIAIRDKNSDYPYEVFVMVDEIKLYSIAKLDNVKHLPQFKEFVKAHLLEQLTALENDREVTA